MSEHDEFENDQKFIMKMSVVSSTLKIVQEIFDRHELVQDESFFDYELLKAALERKHISIINYLLKLGCRVKNPNTVNSELETALHLAMKVNNAGIIKKMLKNGAFIDDKNLNGDTALYTAFIGGHSIAVKEALTFVSTSNRKHLKDFYDPNFKGGIDPTNVDNIRHFQIACVTDHYDAVKYYLKYDFDVNSPLTLNSAKFFGSNLLHYATSERLTRKILDMLLEKGGDISIKNSNGKTPLQIIYYSDFVARRYLIERIFDKGNNTKFINSVDDNGVSHFHVCCAINYPEHVQLFIDGGIDVNRPISSNCSKYPGYTPLHIAVMHGCEKVVQLLLENAADCKKESTDGTTPLHLACNLIRGELKYSIIDMLLRYNACPAVVDKNSCTPLHITFWSLHPYEVKLRKVVDKLIAKIPREINFTDNKGLSHFHIVCIGNDISRVIDFLQYGVDVNSCVKSSENYNGYTALHFAVLYNYKDLVEVLLKWNAQVNVQTNSLQLTPLHLACNFDHKKFLEMYIQDDKSLKSDLISNCLQSQLEIIKLLLLHGADVDAQDSLGQTPLLRTCKIDSAAHLNNTSEICTRVKQIIEILLLNKANIKACTNSQQSILHIVSENRYLNESEELVEYLLTKGANIHAVNNAGFTPLHVAVKSHKKELVQIFLKHQADVNAKSKNFLIPLQMIINYNFFIFTNKAFISSSSNDVVCPLLENGSYVNVRSEDTKTLLQAAIESQNSFVINKLLYYGADINMEDSFGNATVFSLVDWENEMENKVSFAIVFQIVFTHVQKLLALGLHVSQKVQICCTKLSQRYRNVLSEVSAAINDLKNLDNVFDDCLEELDKMKLIKIDNYTSLYNILIKDAHEISKHVRNNTLVEILENPDVDNNFPLYSFLLKLNYKKGLERSDVLKLSKAALHYSITLNLPDLCYDSILQYLSNEDIINLKAAVSINNYKRKLSSGDSCDAEPSAKMTKK